MVADKIRAFEGSAKQRQYKLGELYYNTDNEEISNREFKIAYQSKSSETSFGSVQTANNPYKSNNKIASSHYKLLIDQKINYILGKPPVYNELVEVENIDPRITLYYAKLFDREYKKCATLASKKGIAWGHIYIEDKKLKIKALDPDNIIPTFDENGNLTELRKFWYKEEKDGKKKKTILYVELWTDIEVITYRIDGKNEMEISRRYHIQDTVKFGEAEPVVESENGWGKVPFIPMFNDEQSMYDLKPVKSLIDAWDKVYSDFANNLEDFKDIYWILKNYNGSSARSFLEQANSMKVIKIDGDGEAAAQTFEVPHLARKTFLELANADIMKFGMGLDTDALASGALTNVIIKARYSNLDLKADGFVSYLEQFVDEYQYFVNRHIDIMKLGQPLIVEPTYTKSMIANEVEILKANAEQMGAISELTRLSNHVWVDNAQKEIERIEEEQQDSVIEQ